MYCVTLFVDKLTEALLPWDSPYRMHILTLFGTKEVMLYLADGKPMLTGRSPGYMFHELILKAHLFAEEITDQYRYFLLAFLTKMIVSDNIKRQKVDFLLNYLDLGHTGNMTREVVC